MRRDRSLALVILLASCGTDASAPNAPLPPLTAEPVPTGPSCTTAESHRCTEYPPDRYRPVPGEDAEHDCAAVGGAWATTPCSRDGVRGSCATTFGTVVVHYDDLATTRPTCTGFGGQWFAVPPPPPTSTVPPPPPRRYVLREPSGYGPNVAVVQRTGFATLEAHVSTRTYGPARAHVVVVLRDQIVDEALLSTWLSLDESQQASLGSAGVEVTSVEHPTNVGATALRWITVSPNEDGSELRTFTLSVLDGTRGYVLTCAGPEAAAPRWERDCVAVLDSFHLE